MHRDDRVQLQATLGGLTSQYLQFTFLSSKNAADATPWTLRPGDPADRTALANIVHTSPLTSYGAAVVSLTGAPLTTFPSARALPAVTDPGYAPLRNDLLAGQPGLSYVMGTGAGVPVIAFAVPISRSGHPVGLLVTFADVRHWPLQGYDAEMHIGGRADSIVVDGDGRDVAATTTSQLGQRLAGLPAHVTTGGTGATTATIRGVRTVVSYSPAGHGWTALTLQPVTTFSGALTHSRDVAVLALAALLSAAIVLLVVFHHKRQKVLGDLAEQRLYDPLTGLGQRRVFHMRLDAALARRRRDDHPVGVLYCDLDGFKAINDQYGHNTGDKLLAAVAQRISTAIRDTDTAARLGGDEFAVILDHTSPADAQDVAERIRRAVAEPLTLHGYDLEPQISVGGAIVTTGDARPDELLHEADLAMYQAKHTGQGSKVVVTSGTPADPTPGPVATPVRH